MYTRMIPPHGVMDRREAGPQCLREEVRFLRTLTWPLVQVVRQLKSLTGIQLWPERRRKVLALRVLGMQKTFHGVSERPRWPSPDSTYDVLCRVLRTSSVEPLEQYSRRVGLRIRIPSEQISSAYLRMSPSSRESLARWLRQLHTGAME